MRHVSNEQVQKAAKVRGLVFDGKRKWLNRKIGFGYEVFNPHNITFKQAKTIPELYELVKTEEVIKK